jgi:hypothetical protein
MQNASHVAFVKTRAHAKGPSKLILLKVMFLSLKDVHIVGFVSMHVQGAQSHLNVMIVSVPKAKNKYNSVCTSYNKTGKSGIFPVLFVMYI